MAIENLKDLLGTIQKEWIPTSPRYYVQDSDGSIHSFGELPYRLESDPLRWEGKDKRVLTVVPKFTTWHNHVVLFDGKVSQNVVCGGLVKDVEKVPPKPNLSTIFPERAFTGLHSDVENAKTYFMKAEDAEKRNIKFDMSFSDFSEIVSNKICCISGVELDTTSKHNGPTKFSLDRLDPTLGYVKGNVVVMSSEINNLKSDLDKFLSCGLSDELLLKVIYKVENVLRKRIKKKKEAEAAVNEEQAVREASFKLRYGILPTSKGVK